MSEEPPQTPDEQHDADSTNGDPVVDGRESANDVAEELKEQEERIEEGGEAGNS